MMTKSRRFMTLLLAVCMLLSVVPSIGLSVQAEIAENEAVFTLNLEKDGVTNNIFAAEYNGVYYAMGAEIEGQAGKRAAVEITRTDGNPGPSRIVADKTTAELFTVTTERYVYSSGSYPIDQFKTKNGYLIDNNGTLSTVESTDADNSKWAFDWDYGYRNHGTYRKIYLVIDGEKKYFTLCESAQLPDETHIAVERFHEDCKHVNMIHHPAKAPTCKQDGNHEYWECPECINVYFLDADGITQTYNRPTLMSYGAVDNNSDGVCDDCGKNMPVFKKVTEEKQIVDGGKYILVTQAGDKFYAMATGTEMYNTEFPAVEITPTADGTFQFMNAVPAMNFDLRFAAMVTEWGSGIRYGVATVFNGKMSEFTPIYDGEFGLFEYDNNGAKYGFYVGLNADGSVKMNSAYDLGDYFRAYTNTDDNTNIFVAKDYSANAAYTENPVYLYRLAEAGAVGSNSYEIEAEKSDTNYSDLSNAAEGGTNISGVPNAMTQTSINAILNVFVAENGIADGEKIQVNTNVNVAVKNYAPGESITLSLTPKANVSCGGETQSYDISDSAFDGITPMTVVLYTGGIMPRQIVHEKQDGTKEFFYEAGSDEVIKNGQKAFYPFFDNNGNGYVSFTVTEFSDIHILAEYPETIYFGLNTLTDAKLHGAYESIYAGVESKAESIDLSAYGLTREQLDKVVELYRYDHTEHYWFPNGYSMTVLGDKIIELKLTNLTGYDNAAFEAAANELLKAADGKTADYDKALALHDALVKHIVYDTAAAENPASNPKAFNAYGAIVEGKSVCEGYAEAYQYLLQKVGIQSYIVTGTSKDMGHEWNLVRLDGKYYYTDVTWDDPVSSSGDEGKPIYYPYFNITTARLEEDHTITDTYGILPECTDESQMYKGYTKLDAFTVDSVAAAFNQQIGTQKIARIYNTGAKTIEEFKIWFSANFNNIAIQAGLNGATYASIGREIYIAGQVPAVSATSIILDKVAVTLKNTETVLLTATVNPTNSTDIVKWISDHPEIASVDENGNVTAHKSGTAVITATAGAKSATCAVTVMRVAEQFAADYEAVLNAAAPAGDDALAMYVAYNALAEDVKAEVDALTDVAAVLDKANVRPTTAGATIRTGIDQNIAFYTKKPAAETSTFRIKEMGSVICGLGYAVNNGLTMTKGEAGTEYGSREYAAGDAADAELLTYLQGTGMGGKDTWGIFLVARSFVVYTDGTNELTVYSNNVDEKNAEFAGFDSTGMVIRSVNQIIKSIAGALSGASDELCTANPGTANVFTDVYAGKSHKDLDNLDAAGLVLVDGVKNAEETLKMLIAYNNLIAAAVVAGK